MSNETSTGSEERCFKTIAASAPPLFENGKIVLQTYHIGWIISGLFTLVAVAVSFWLIRRHLQWYTNKREQRYIVRLLFMVPLYAVISFASFLFWNHSTPIILIRDAYEAIVLTAFFYLLLMYVSHDPEEQKRVFLRAGLSVEADNIAIQKGQDVEEWVFPLGFVKWKPRDGLYFLQLMKWGVLQYCVIRPTSTLAAVILNYVGLYCEDSWGVGWGHIYITIIMSISVTIAMYCLLQLYFPIAKDLAPHQPLLKLFSVKAVVFLTFWQATFLSMLSVFGIVKDTKYMTADDVNNAIAAILETFEMMLFAFLHIKAFTYKPYTQISKEGLCPSRSPQWRSLGHAMDFRETLREIWIGCVYMFDSMRGKEPTADFGVVRGSHYEGAFGRQRPAVGIDRQPHTRDHRVNVADLTYPTFEIEVDQDVEVIVSGRREWLFLEKFNQRLGHPAREKSEGLQEQIDHELALRGLSGESDHADLTNNGELMSRPNAQAGGQIPWWRSLYNRISQTGHEPDEEEKQPFRQKTLSRSRSYRHHRNSTKVPPQKITEQPPFDALNARPSESVAYEEHDALPPQIFGHDRHVNDLQQASQWRYDDQSIPGPGSSSAHGVRRNTRSSTPGTVLPSSMQALRSPPPMLHNGESGLRGPMVSLESDIVPTMSFTSAPQPTPHWCSSEGPARASTRKHDMRHSSDGQAVYATFSWDPPPHPPQDVDTGGHMISPVEPQRNSVPYREPRKMESNASSPRLHVVGHPDQ
ncbi:hypothetical protein HYPSUDRAFT_42863 [Hypholoma sublateritium FD-334 SS-4]|uniref:DUF300-domain-containing protein n=1 Tax=Hypholoma sublateritium (strain FD-334 SS-4) TaxID=945553 RepID=A0A0D2NWB1_HYPSF|nr:hypothetical protein HYPSUDRAFT_42863 [Hypholoma sublateritium FD-334 SS-4]